MDIQKIAAKLAKELVGTGMTDRLVRGYVDKVNKYIAKAKSDDVWGIEPDSTWESSYEFEPVKLSRSSVIFRYSEVHGKKNQVERFNYTDDNVIDDLKWQFSWVIRAIKKGYREVGLSVPKF